MSRYAVGLEKLVGTEKAVAEMQIELRELQPKLEVARVETEADGGRAER